MTQKTTRTVLSLAVLVGCSRPGSGGPPRVPVTVARASERAVPVEIIATGTAEPLQTVSVQAQVTGILLRVTFHEGDEVAGAPPALATPPAAVHTRHPSPPP